MSEARTIAKNSLYILLGNVSERVIGFFILLALVRYLGIANFGKYSLIYAFLSFFQIFSVTGIDYLIFRELSKDYERGAKLLGSALTLKLLFSVIGIISCWIILQWISYSKDLKLLIYIASLGMLFSFGTLFNNVFQAKLLTKYVAVITIVIKIILAIGTFSLIALKAKLSYFILINLLVYVFQIICAFYLAKRVLIFRMNINLALWKELLKYSWPLIINVIFVSLYTRIDQILLFHFKGAEALGFYAAAAKLVEVPLLVVAAFLTSAFPMISKYAVTSPDSFKRAYEISFKYLMMFFSLIVMAAMLFSRQIILLCYGSNFLPSQTAVVILFWSGLFASAAIVNSFLLLATDLQYLDLIFMSSAAVVNLILNLILIPRYSFNGAAISAVISYSLLIPVFYLLKKTRAFAKAIVESMVKPFFAALISGYFVYSFLKFHPAVNLAVGTALYLSLLLFMKGINSQDIKYAREIAMLE